MRELNFSEIEIVSGAVKDMSTDTKIALAVTTIVSPLAGAAFAVGYYLNRDN